MQPLFLGKWGNFLIVLGNFFQNFGVGSSLKLLQKCNFLDVAKMHLW